MSLAKNIEFLRHLPRLVAETSVGKTVPDSARMIDLNGRTVIPGLVDNHNHFVLLSQRPGHDTRLESTATIADVQSAVAARTKTVPPGAWITAMGGWVPEQFVERRLPTLQELDAAAANNPVILFQTFVGPAAVNSRARQFFAAWWARPSSAWSI